MSASPSYERLAALAEQEWSAVTAGAWEELPGLAAQRAALQAALPLAPPPAAGPHLARMAELHGLVAAALHAARADHARELTRLTAGRGAVHGYAASAAHRPSAG